MDFYFVFIFVKLLSPRVLQFLQIFCLVCFVFLVSIKSTFHPFVTFTFFLLVSFYIFLSCNLLRFIQSQCDSMMMLLLCLFVCFFVTVHTFKQDFCQTFSVTIFVLFLSNAGFTFCQISAIFEISVCFNNFAVHRVKFLFFLFHFQNMFQVEFFSFAF